MWYIRSVTNWCVLVVSAALVLVGREMVKAAGKTADFGLAGAGKACDDWGVVSCWSACQRLQYDGWNMGLSTWAMNATVEEMKGR